MRRTKFAVTGFQGGGETQVVNECGWPLKAEKGNKIEFCSRAFRKECSPVDALILAQRYLCWAYDL
jgi:hypothetical protein